MEKLKIFKLIFLLIIGTTTIFGGSMEFKDTNKIELTAEDWKILEEDMKREPTFIEIKYDTFIVKKEYIQFYDEIIVEDEMYKNQYKKVINGEKILIPTKVQKNGIVWRHDYGHNFYTYEFAVREDEIYLNGFIYINGKWKEKKVSRSGGTGMDGLATVSALLAGVIIAPVSLIIDLLKSPFKSEKK